MKEYQEKLNKIYKDNNLEEEFWKNFDNGSVCCWLGTRRSGKTTSFLALLKWAIDHNKFSEYHLVISNFTNEASNTYGWMNEKEYDKYDIRIYKKFSYQQLDYFNNEKQKYDKSRNYLYVIEDATKYSELFYMNEALKEIIFECRHCGGSLSIIIIAHSLRGTLSTNLRDNFSFFFITKIYSRSMLIDTIWKDYFSLEMEDKKVFCELMKMHMHRDHGILMIDFDKSRIDFHVDYWRSVNGNLKYVLDWVKKHKNDNINDRKVKKQTCNSRISSKRKDNCRPEAIQLDFQQTEDS